MFGLSGKYLVLAFLLFTFCLSGQDSNNTTEKVAPKPVGKSYTSSTNALAQVRSSEQNIVVARNATSLLPFRSTLNKRFSLIQFSNSPFYNFQLYFEKYADFYAISQLDPEKENLDFPVINDLYRSTFIIALDDIHLDAERDAALIANINRLSKRHKVVVINFDEASNLQFFNTKIILLQVFERSPLSEAFAAQILFGGAESKGILTEDISEDLTLGMGEQIPQIRLKYTIPEEVGIDASKLEKIDELAASGILEGAFPGCQVLIAKEGKVIYDKCFGHHTYEAWQTVKPTDLYDLASVTKVAATTLASMKLYQEGSLALNAKIQDYIYGKSSIHYTSIDRLLTHRSGLQPNLPIADYIFHARDSLVRCDTFFCEYQRYPYTVPVAKNVYFDEQELEKVWENIFELRPNRRKRYQYSDVNFSILQRIIEAQSRQPLDNFLEERFYRPLGLRRLLYNPLCEYEASEITPTSVDNVWRRQTLRGHVHDESAALMGGVGGNAGLFGNAEDLAALFQMLLNGGVYGGKRLLFPETIDLFTARYGSGHRGLGFDKPSSRKKYLPYAYSASSDTYGHTGFSGTCVWVDPKHDLIFILLSNRIHPSKSNRQLTRRGIRSKMHQVVYDALGTYSESDKVTVRKVGL